MKRITEVTKMDIYEIFRDGIIDDSPFNLNIEYPYYGRLNEVDFLDRLYSLRKMESSQNRFNNAYDEIAYHIYNNDYPNCWIFGDERFPLKEGSDEEYLKFLCEVFHPYVRNEQKGWQDFLGKINALLRVDGYELYPKEMISGRYVYAWRACGENVVNEMSKEALIDLAERFKFGLLAKATNGDIDEREYERCRKILMNVTQIEEYIPDFLSSNRSAQDFRRYMQGVDQHYAGRRTIITQEMDALIDVLESKIEKDPFKEMQEYRQLEMLDSGGYGTVYRYHNECLDMDFAVKIYEPVFMSSEEQAEGEKGSSGKLK